MVSELLVGLVVVAGLLALSAFFSGSEIALFSLDSRQLESFGTDERSGSQAVARLHEDPHRLLITILVGNNVVNIAIATVVTTLVASYVAPSRVALVATVVGSTVVLLFGEILPKSYGVANAPSLARRVARPVAALQVLLYPLVIAFDRVNEALSGVIGGDEEIEPPSVTREEIAALVGTASKLGVIDADEQTLIQRVFRFNSVPVRHVMVPRADLVSIEKGTTVADAIQVCGDARLSRVPVYEETEDHVVGYVDLRDLVNADPEATVGGSDLLVPILHVFEGREVDDLLAEFQEERLELAIVFDEYGAVEGLVTAEDIVEELVGDVFDVGEPRTLVRVDDRSVSARGKTRVEAVNEAIGTALPAPESGTVAALVVETLGRVPQVDETVTIDGVAMTVTGVVGNRVVRVFIQREEGEPSLAE
ncbi:hemolysin family protein [Natronomonas sp. EA1]|uniref:hemolysin family protein n=1 Tax=Natronomonas sp. EA1 TaxID=3421655 RepID=UPI003EBDA307